MSVADVAREYGISQTRLNAIIAVNKPIEKFKLEQDLNIHVLQEEFDQFVQDDFAKEENKMEFRYDLSKFKTIQKQDNSLGMNRLI